MNSLIGNCGINGKKREYIDPNGRCYLRSSDILKLLRNPHCLRDIGKVYRKYVKYLNENSLVILVDYSSLDAHSGRSYVSTLYRLEMRHGSHKLGPSRYNIRDFPYLRNRRGFLFTGDLSARSRHTRKRIFDSLVNYYGIKNISNLLFYQVPHHGSENGWSDALNSLDTVVAAVSYGFPNIYHHPDLNHLENVRIRCRSGTLAEVYETAGRFTSYWYYSY